MMANPAGLERRTSTEAPVDKLVVERPGMSCLTGRSGDYLCAVQDVSFAAAGHEFLTLIGPSGCGKPTVLMDEPRPRTEETKDDPGFLHAVTRIRALAGGSPALARPDMPERMTIPGARR